MIDQMGDELLLAAVPSIDLVKKLWHTLAFAAGSNEVYLAYVSGWGSRFAGFLVGEIGNIDRLIAHCPVPTDLETGSGLWRREVRRQLQLAIRISSQPNNPIRSSDAIWFDQSDQVPEVPAWVYSLCCVPIRSDWNGRLLHPRPFCPKLFESMVMQPQAPKWILQRMWPQRLGAASGPVPGNTGA